MFYSLLDFIFKIVSQTQFRPVWTASGKWAALAAQSQPGHIGSLLRFWPSPAIKLYIGPNGPSAACADCGHLFGVVSLSASASPSHSFILLLSLSLCPTAWGPIKRICMYMFRVYIDSPAPLPKSQLDINAQLWGGAFTMIIFVFKVINGPAAKGFRMGIDWLEWRGIGYGG